MAEYIDRESIRKAIQSVTNDPNCPLFIAAMIEQYIDEEPSADVAPVKHGMYNPPSSRDGKPCSVCPASAVYRDGEAET